MNTYYLSMVKEKMKKSVENMIAKDRNILDKVKNNNHGYFKLAVY